MCVCVGGGGGGVNYVLNTFDIAAVMMVKDDSDC